MDGTLPFEPIRFGFADLARLMPMHLWVDRDGLIRTAGPTLAKLGPEPMGGLHFFDVFDLRKPLGVTTAADLAGLAGHRILLAVRQGAPHTLRGVAVRAGDGQGTFINLSFGLAVAEAVRDHQLSHADFAPTDLTVELLYLTEVKGAVMGELAALNARLRKAHEQAEAAATTDALTGLANRRGFENSFARTLSEAERGGAFLLLHLDLDHFKEINDTLGHAAGDKVLIHVASVLRAELRGQDVSARIGGDEFVALVRGRFDDESAQRLATRLIAGIERFAPATGASVRLSASVGAVLSQRHPAPRTDHLLAMADAALYGAKRAGRARCVVAGPGSAP
jgi:diguanylate cyclase (GGDEF)-like protein